MDSFQNLLYFSFAIFVSIGMCSSATVGNELNGGELPANNFPVQHIAQPVQSIQLPPGLIREYGEVPHSPRLFDKDRARSTTSTTTHRTTPMKSTAKIDRPYSTGKHLPPSPGQKYGKVSIDQRHFNEKDSTTTPTTTPRAISIPSRELSPPAEDKRWVKPMIGIGKLPFPRPANVQKPLGVHSTAAKEIVLQQQSDKDVAATTTPTTPRTVSVQPRTCISRFGLTHITRPRLTETQRPLGDSLENDVSVPPPDSKASLLPRIIFILSGEYSLLSQKCLDAGSDRSQSSDD